MAGHVKSWKATNPYKGISKDELDAIFAKYRPKKLRTYYDASVQHDVTEYEARQAEGDIK